MKKIICMLLTITIVFSATACSSNKSNDSKKEKSKNEEVKKEKKMQKKRHGLILKSSHLYSMISVKIVQLSMRQ